MTYTEQDLDAIDALIAEHVMGWKISPGGWWDTPDGAPKFKRRFTRSGEAMLEVIAEARTRGLRFIIDTTEDAVLVGVTIKGVSDSPMWMPRSTNSVPIAVCLAALAAVGKPWSPKP